MYYSMYTSLTISSQTMGVFGSHHTVNTKKDIKGWTIVPEKTGGYVNEWCSMWMTEIGERWNKRLKRIREGNLIALTWIFEAHSAFG